MTYKESSIKYLSLNGITIFFLIILQTKTTIYSKIVKVYKKLVKIKV